MTNHDTYCKLLVTKHTFGDKYDIIADFGSGARPAFAIPETVDSEIDALNLMAANGWVLVSSLSNQVLSPVKYIFRKSA